MDNIDAHTNGDSGAADRAVREVAEALTRIAQDPARLAREGQALAEEVARAATQRRIAAAIAQGIAERAHRLAEARQRVAEEAARAAAAAVRLRTETLAAAAVRLRTETLAAVAHDLRTPLTSLVGRAGLVHDRLARGTDFNPDCAWLGAQLDAVRAAATRLHGIIAELDDVTALAAGRDVEVAREPVDVASLARAVAEGFALQRAVVVEAPPAPVVVVGDRVRLDRVLQNLVGNAIKYSPPDAPVAVTVTRGAGVAVIAVRDRGVGIPAADLPRVFERYYRATTARGIAGSGLGLAGARAIIARHNGSISVESVESAGTTVTLTVPLAPDAEV